MKLPENFVELLYQSDLCSGSQTDDAINENDFESYWLNDITIAELKEFLEKL